MCKIMIKYARKIIKKERVIKFAKLLLVCAGTKLNDWECHGYLPSGEGVWYNEIDDYVFTGHVN